MKIAARYEKLDSVGRGAVNAIMKYEESRMAEELQKVSRLDAETGAMLDMIVYTDPSAAGIPLYAENDYERIEFPASEVRAVPTSVCASPATAWSRQYTAAP